MYAVTLDEAWIYMKVDGGKMSFCYIRRGEKIPDEWVKQERSLWERKFMIVAAMSYRGTFPLIQLKAGVRMDSWYYINYVLRPLIHKHIPQLYGSDISEVFVHYDKSPVHVSNFTTMYTDLMTERYGITFINKDNIPVKGADCSPLDFFGFGYLKNKIRKSSFKSLDALWRRCQVEWSRDTPDTCVRVFRSWKKRCRMINERQGSHVEKIKAIHEHKQPLKKSN